MQINGIEDSDLNGLFLQFVAALHKAPKDIHVRVNTSEVDVFDMSGAFDVLEKSVLKKAKIGFSAELIRRADGLRKGVGGILECDSPKPLRDLLAEIIENIAETYMQGENISIPCATDGCYIIQWETMCDDGNGGYFPVTENAVVLFSTQRKKRFVSTFDKKYTIDEFKMRFPDVKIITRVL
jgi:hypothetical protein